MEGYVTSDGYASQSEGLGDTETESASPSGSSSSGYDPNGPDRDCSDFDTQAAAQKFYKKQVELSKIRIVWMGLTGTGKCVNRYRNLKNGHMNVPLLECFLPNDCNSIYHLSNVFASEYR